MTGNGAPQEKGSLKGNGEHGSGQQSRPEIAGQDAGQRSDGKAIEMDQKKDGHAGQQLFPEKIGSQTVKGDHEKIGAEAEQDGKDAEKEKTDETPPKIHGAGVRQGIHQHALSAGKQVPEKNHGRKKAGDGKKNAKTLQPQQGIQQRAGEKKADLRSIIRQRPAGLQRHAIPFVQGRGQANQRLQRKYQNKNRQHGKAQIKISVQKETNRMKPLILHSPDPPFPR